MLSISFEDLCSGLFVREREGNWKIDSAEHCRVEVNLPIGGADEKHIGAGLKAVNFPEESW